MANRCHKVSLLAGENFWETVAIPEKGIPSIKVRSGTKPKPMPCTKSITEKLTRYPL